MAYGRAVLGESLELCNEAADWFAEEQKRLEKNERARKKVMNVIYPMIERNRQQLIKGQKTQNQ